MTHPIIPILVELGSEQSQPSEYGLEMTTEQVIASMLTENTGRHMLDSGGAYGRQWERNQGRDFADEPEVEARFYTYEARKYDSKPDGELVLQLDASINVYHWLTSRLEFAPEIDAALQAYGEARPDEHWLETMEGFAELHSSGGSGDWARPSTTNTYNHESALSQVLQFTQYEDAETDEQVVLLQVHGGCDVRGGYTAPRAFTVIGYDGAYVMFDDARLYMGCHGSTPSQHPGQVDLTTGEPIGFEPCGAGWDSDDAGYHWYENGNAYPDKFPDLHEFPVEEGTEGRKGVVVVDEESGKATCPVCGTGTLEVYAMLDC